MSRPAPLWRRFARTSFWLVIGALVLGLVAGAGLVDLSPFRPPADWFFTEWILQAWLDEPWNVLVAPIVVVLAASVLQTLSASFSWDPTLGLLRMSIVDSRGFAPAWWQWPLRFVGVVLSWATLGFGFLLAWVSRHGRSLADLISSTAIRLDEDD